MSLLAYLLVRVLTKSCCSLHLCSFGCPSFPSSFFFFFHRKTSPSGGSAYGSGSSVASTVPSLTQTHKLLSAANAPLKLLGDTWRHYQRQLGAQRGCAGLQRSN